MFEFFYRRGHLLAAIIGGMFIFGVLGLIYTPKNLFPDSNRPEVVIFTSLPGASPSTIAASVSKPIENEMATLSRVYQITSTSVPNFSIVRVVFDYGKGLEQSAVDVSNGLNRIKAQLPPGATSAIYLVGDFTLPVDLFVVYPKTPDLSLAEVRQIVENYIKPALLKNPNIGNVEIFGGYRGAIMIKLDPLLLSKYHLSLGRVIKVLRETSKNSPIGFTAGNGRFITLTYYGEEAQVARLKNLFIAPNLRLGDIAEVKWSYQTSNSGFIGNGHLGIAVSVERAPGGNVLKTSDEARKVMARLEREFPNLKIEVADTQRQLIETSNSNMLEALRDAIIFTLIVILFFLGNLRAIVAAGLSIPMVFFGTIAFLYLTGQGLNIVIYTAIILALGMLTDDAVVVLENIERHIEEGDPDPIYNGTKEVLKPVFAGTLSTIVVVAPLMFVGGFPEKIFRPLVETLIVALLLSYFLSITFIPKLATLLFKNGTQKWKIELFFEKVYQKSFGRLIPFYLGILRFSNGRPSIPRRMVLMMGAMATLMITLRVVMPLLGRDVMPPMDTGIIKVRLEFASNLDSNRSIAELQPFLRWLHSQNWVERSAISIGTEPGVLSVGGGGSGNSVEMTITAVDRFHRKKTIWELEEEIRKKLSTLPNLKKLAVFDFGATALSTIRAPLDVQFRGDDYRPLLKEAEAAAQLLHKVRGLTSVTTSWDKGLVEGVIKIDPNRALYYHITPLEILSQIALKDQGVTMETSLVSLLPQPIRVRFNGDFGSEMEALKLLPIVTPKGVVPLSALASLETHFTYTKIERYNLSYSIDVEGYRSTRPVTKLTDDANRLLTQNGFTNYHQVGDIKELNDAFKRLIKAVGVGVILLLLTLMVVYRSLRLALIMIVVLPLSMIGGAWGMLIAHKPACMPSMVGLLLLFGIIIKNAVLLIDFYKEFEAKGETPFEAALESVRIRFRPVMMTAFGTIAGMLPIALEMAVGLERLSPLADVAVGGLLVGTLLTLVYVPMLAYITDPRRRHPPQQGGEEGEGKK